MKPNQEDIDYSSQLFDKIIAYTQEYGLGLFSDEWGEHVILKIFSQETMKKLDIVIDQKQHLRKFFNQSSHTFKLDKYYEEVYPCVVLMFVGFEAEQKRDFIHFLLASIPGEEIKTAGLISSCFTQEFQKLNFLLFLDSDAEHIKKDLQTIEIFKFNILNYYFMSFKGLSDDLRLLQFAFQVKNASDEIKFALLKNFDEKYQNMINDNGIAFKDIIFDLLGHNTAMIELLAQDYPYLHDYLNKVSIFEEDNKVESINFSLENCVKNFNYPGWTEYAYLQYLSNVINVFNTYCKDNNILGIKFLDLSNNVKPILIASLEDNSTLTKEHLKNFLTTVFELIDNQTFLKIMNKKGVNNTIYSIKDEEKLTTAFSHWTLQCSLADKSHYKNKVKI